MYIYLILSLESGQVKIGKTKDINKRINSLQTGNGGNLKIIDYFESNYSNKLEKYLHNIFSHENTVGEWFTLSVSEIYEFKTICKKMEKIYISLEKMNKTIVF